jgi:hypothetical protein
MRLTPLSLPALLVVAALTVLGCKSAGPEEPEKKPSQAQPTVEPAKNPQATFIVLRRDVRKCMSPMCGGFFVRRTDQEKTVCHDGTSDVECYVAEIELPKPPAQTEEEASRLRTAVETGQQSVPGELRPKKYDLGEFGVLVVSEAWQPQAR